jgi:hypothetical protein
MFIQEEIPKPKSQQKLASAAMPPEKRPVSAPEQPPKKASRNRLLWAFGAAAAAGATLLVSNCSLQNSNTGRGLSLKDRAVLYYYTHINPPTPAAAEFPETLSGPPAP